MICLRVRQFPPHFNKIQTPTQITHWVRPASNQLKPFHLIAKLSHSQHPNQSLSLQSKTPPSSHLTRTVASQTSFHPSLLFPNLISSPKAANLTPKSPPTHIQTAKPSAKNHIVNMANLRFAANEALLLEVLIKSASRPKCSTSANASGNQGWVNAKSVSLDWVLIPLFLCNFFSLSVFFWKRKASNKISRTAGGGSDD